MNKKIISLIVALILPTIFLVGCKKSQDDFYMTEDTTALDGSVEYSAKTYKDAFFSTKNYSDEYLQEELNSIIDEITSNEDKKELVKLLKAYTSNNESDLNTIKSCFEKYNVIKQSSNNSDFESNPMYEISNRLYKATLNATKKYYDINDFYIYYKSELSSSSLTGEDLENEIKITAIKEYTTANIYKSSYNDSFISKTISELDRKEAKEKEKQIAPDEENKDENKDKNKDENKGEDKDKDKDKETTTEVETPSTDNPNNENNTYPEYLELTEVIKSQIYDAGVNSAIEFLGEKFETSPSEYARIVYDALENDNPLGDNKEEGYKSFLSGFETTLKNNGVEFK